ncbi:unnamed protein product [Polarella glacialis]|uniref:Uncharacterized protein n=1 Tax=Polarella glacialis TaxID=89957 RepID=A0A813D9T5_POLGL|nr:unnamed protein product [Polarella glacialis]
MIHSSDARPALPTLLTAARQTAAGKFQERECQSPQHLCLGRHGKVDESTGRPNDFIQMASPVTTITFFKGTPSRQDISNSAANRKQHKR